MGYKSFIWRAGLSLASMATVGALFFVTQHPVSSDPAAVQDHPQPASAPSANVHAQSADVALSLKSSTTATNHATAFWYPRADEPAFVRFSKWFQEYDSAADRVDKAALEREGAKLAMERRMALAELIQRDPQRALQLATPVSVRRALPESIRSLLEARVNGRGSLEVLAALPEPGREKDVIPVFRKSTIAGKPYSAFVYGEREGEPTRSNTSLHGIAVNNLLAVHEDRVRVLEPAEASDFQSRAKEALCSVSGQPATVNNDATGVEVGGEIQFVCGANHIKVLNRRLIAQESGGSDTAAADDTPIAASAWTEGQKNLILIRVDFPDLTGASFSDSAGTNLINGLNSFYSEMSYGKTGFAPPGGGSELTPTFRMPQPASWYGTNDNYNQLRTDARNAATAAGYVLANYNLDVTCMGAVPGFAWSGLAYIGAVGAWIRATSATGVAGHELGHNYGLNHANFWDTGGQSVIGAGTSVEYGDSFDTMGAASAGNNHFNARYKSYLNWLTANDVVTATSNGTYRVFAHDDATATGVRGLKIVKNAGTNYWVEFRQKFTSSKWLMNGAGLRWAQSGNQKSQLLDTTPGSVDGKNDSAIVIGRTFSDFQSGIHITPIGKGGTVPESLDVVVNFGSFPGNIPPTLTLLASATNGSPGTTLTFTANATDANGDALAYYWDFGDGNFGSNDPNATKSWNTAGDYLVRCTVTDMKGGTASDSVLVTIGAPTTYRMNGLVATSDGTPVQNVRIYVTSTRMTYTDSDGTYTLVGLPAGTYTVGASLENYSFSASGFSNPVTVGPNSSGLNFLAAYSTSIPPSITTQPLSQTVNPGSNVTFSVVATGSTPLAYQWLFNSANISGATSTSYTKSNVQSVDAGNYSVVVSNSAGTVASVNATLSVNLPPAIVAQPQGQTVIAGTNVLFSVGAAGSAPLTYQWRRNGTNIAGAVASTYTRTNAQPVDSGNYNVVVANSLGAVTSAPAPLAVNFSLNAIASFGGTINKNPDETSYAPNAAVTLTAAPVSVFPFSGWSGDASGTNNPLTVLMTANKTITANFTSPVPDLIIDNPAATFAGSWAIASTASDKYGTDYRTAATSANSASATATFVPNIQTAGRYDVYIWFPSISKGLAGTQVSITDADGILSLSVSQTTGSGGWRLLAAGAGFAQVTNGSVRLSNQGQAGKIVVADAVRWVYSENQTASQLPIITSQPVSQTATQGTSAAFVVIASGGVPLDFQWRFNTSNLAGATNDTLQLTNAQSTDAGNYSVAINNSEGSVTSAVATLTVLVPPRITLQPRNQSVIAGEPVTLGVNADGTMPLEYHWRWNGTDLPGGTNSTLILTGAQPADAGDYDVVIANVVGAVTSVVAQLSVNTPPEILAQPQGQQLPVGSNVLFSVTTAGTAPLSYQWRKDGANLADSFRLSGAHSAVLGISQLQLQDQGAYTVLITNVAGAMTSVEAPLTVFSLVPFQFQMPEVTPGGVRLTLAGNPGEKYDIQTTTNFLNWSSLLTLTNETGTIQFSQPTTNLNRRFYRGRIIP